MGSEWGEFCEANGWNPGSEEDYDKFLESLEAGSEARSGPDRLLGSLRFDTYEQALKWATTRPDDLLESPRFDTYEQAVKWAKANPGIAVGRTVDGRGFEAKPLRIPNTNVSHPQNSVGRNVGALPVRKNEIWSYSIRCNEISRYSAQLTDVLTKSGNTKWQIIMRPFSRPRWKQELQHLSSEQLGHLHLLLRVHIEDQQSELNSIKEAIRRSRKMKPGNYGEDVSQIIIEFTKTVLLDVEQFLVRS